MAMDTGNAMAACGLCITNGKNSFLDVMKYAQKYVTVERVTKSSQTSLVLHCV